MTEFEKACSEIEDDTVLYDGEIENCIEWLKGADTATVCFSQKKMIRKIESLALSNPDECKIVAKNKGSIVAHIPTKWIRIGKIEHNLSDDQREALRERMLEIRKKKGRGKASK